MASGDLHRDALIKLVEAITRGDGATEQEDDRLLHLFEDSVVHPAASDLIFYSHKYFGEEYRHKQPTAEQVVDMALEYKPIELGPAE